MISETETGMAPLQADGVVFSYTDGPVLRGVSISLEQGELVGLVGPNGSGKTTLIRVLSGLLAPGRGYVLLGSQNIRRLKRKEIGRRVAVVPQGLHMPFGFSSYEMVMLGRTPHVRPLAGASRHDREIVAEMMLLTATDHLADRPFNDLSGGEQQRVIVAMALAQEPEVLLLDEPVVHLDISHQVEILELIKRLNRDRGLTVLATMHDLNLAALYFDRLLLLDDGRIVREGPPTQVLQEEWIGRVFGAAVQVRNHPTHDCPHVVLLPPTD
jgi:iron complex transport system ATP-binding protein